MTGKTPPFGMCIDSNAAARKSAHYECMQIAEWTSQVRPSPLTCARSDNLNVNFLVLWFTCSVDWSVRVRKETGRKPTKAFVGELPDLKPGVESRFIG